MSIPNTPRTSRWGRWLRAGLALIVLTEITVAILTARLIGIPLTVLTVLAFSASGLWLLHRTSSRALHHLDPAHPAPGTAPTPSGTTRPVPGADLAILAAAGLLLTLPGLLTGILGALAALPPSRRALRPLLLRAVAPIAENLLRTTGMARVVTGEVVEEETVVHVEVVEVREQRPGP
ncbi:MAG: FxsA family protein, partial [Kineosporiaceae bacterium]